MWPPYRTVRDLVHAHIGQLAVVMGGGPTMPAAVAQLPLDALYIAVNDHGLRLLKDQPKLAPRRAAYVVACDKIEERARFDCFDRTRDGASWGLPVISRHMWADYRVPFMPGPNSGMVAAWLARLMGCTPIVLTGMDLYSGPTYHDHPKAASTGKSLVDREHSRRWATVLDRFEGPYRVLGCSPLLAKNCPLYDPAEIVKQKIAAEVLLSEIESGWIRLTRDGEVSKRPFRANSVLEVSPVEADNLVKQRRAVRVTNPEGNACRAI